MATEIERKFLVSGDGWRSAASASYLIRQGYLARTEDCTVRVRRIGDTAFVTIKGRTEGMSRAEFEYEIPVGEADEMLGTLAVGHIVEKRRHHVRVNGHLWEVDEFAAPRPDLVLAEIELQDPAERFEIPDWVGEEVTEDPRYRNAVMSDPDA